MHFFKPTDSVLRAKCKASALHLCLSLLIFASVFVWIWFVLYPSFYFNMSGGKQGLALMFGVDVVLGPLLTLLVFNLKKPLREIISDCVIIGIVQLGALAYGIHTVYQEHPKLLVLYSTGTGTALSLREVNEEPEMQALDTRGFTHLEKIPVVVHTVQDSQTIYQNLAKRPEQLAEMDKLSRPNIKNEQDKMQLAQWEQQYGNVYVLTVMGKYTGAYIVVDKDLRFVGKLGEAET